MNKTCMVIILLCAFSSSVLAYEVLYHADVSCRTRSDRGTPPGSGNNHDNSKLTVRNEGRGEKSWIKFDQLNSYDLVNLRQALLRLTLQSEESGDQWFNVSAVNDDCLDNIDWTERYDADPPPPYAITWNNAPGNDTDSLSDLDAAKTTHLAQVDIAGTDVPGAQYFIDVTDILKADTDGIVQFALHNSSTDLCLATHDHGEGEEYFPTLILTFPPLGADWPDPAVGEIVPDTLDELSWVNPEPNLAVGEITCDVWFSSSEPNAALPDDGFTLLAEGISGSSTSITGLVSGTKYYWKVDCYDSSKDEPLIPGEIWHFIVGVPPVVDAGPDQVVWLDPNSVTVDLDGTTSDDGDYTVLWTQTGGTDVTISPNDVDDTTVTLTERGIYTFKLTADDGLLQTSDTVRIFVGDDACDASHLQTDDPYNDADINEDCIVDLTDLTELILNAWLDCSDTLTNCEL